MNYRMIGFLIGRILLTEAALLALPTVTAILYGESPMPFLTTALALAAVGLLLGSRKPRQSAIYARDGFAVVALAWILMSAFGALPFVLSGDIPSSVSYTHLDVYKRQEREITAISAVPPPMSTTMCPSGLVMSMPAPMAAATGLSLIHI